MKISKNWRPSPFLLSQLLHFFVGTTFVLGAVDLHFPWYGGAVTILVISGIKEVTFDRWAEGDSYQDGLIDWLFYGLGCLAAFILIQF